MFRPAGMYSDSEEYSDDNVYYQKTKYIAEPTAMELKKKSFLRSLKTRDLLAIKEELDKALIGFDIDTEIDNQWNMLYHACFEGWPELVKFLIDERGANINNNTTYRNETPLMVACNSEANSEDVFMVVKYLINENTIISSSNSSGVTPLMFASNKGHESVVKYLLEQKDAIDAVDNDGNNALFHAIDGKQLEVAKMLIESKIDLETINQQGFTAKEHADAENLMDFVELFPPEEYKYQTPSKYLSYNQLFDILPGIVEQSETPAYFPDVVTLLRGMDCERFVNNFAEAGIPLSEFLTINDERMEAIGIDLQLERNIIKMGLHRFHEHNWKKTSIWIPSNFKNKPVNEMDLIYIYANALRQMVILKASLVHLKEMGSIYEMSSIYEYISLDFLNEFQTNLKELRKLIKSTSAGIPKKRPLFVTKNKSQKQMSLAKLTLLSCVPVAVVILVAIKMKGI